MHRHYYSLFSYLLIYLYMFRHPLLPDFHPINAHNCIFFCILSTNMQKRPDAFHQRVSKHIYKFNILCILCSFYACYAASSLHSSRLAGRAAPTQTIRQDAPAGLSAGHGVHLRAGTRCASPAYRTENCRTDIFISAAIRYSDIVRFTQKYSHPDHWACHFRISPSPRLFSS